MLLHATRPGPTMEIAVMMHVGAAVDPSPFPPPAGDEHFVSIPYEARGAPSPGTKRKAERHAKSKDDAAANEEPSHRRSEYDQRIIHRNADKARIHRER